MKPTKLEWEDVIQFEEVEGYGQHIWRDGNHFFYVTEKVERDRYSKYLGRLSTIAGHRRKKRRKLVRNNLY